MQYSGQNRSFIVNHDLYRLICSSPRLQKALFPDPTTGPYKVLAYTATLVLHDRRGARATFYRSQRIRFAQNGISAILDHAWGKGILLTNYQNTAGTLADSFKEQRTRHLVIELKRSMAKGEILDFMVRRSTMESFTHDHGTVETIVDHPIDRLRRRVIFPKSRPALRARLRTGKGSVSLPISVLSDGRTAVEVDIVMPEAHAAYAVDWRW